MALAPLAGVLSLISDPIAVAIVVAVAVVVVFCCFFMLSCLLFVAAIVFGWRFVLLCHGHGQ